MKILNNIATQAAIALVLMVSFNSVAQITIDPNDPGNATNPFDDAGTKHNQVVEYFLNNYNTKELSVEQVIENSKKVLNRFNISDGELSHEQFENGIKDVKNNFSNIISKTSLTKEGKSKLQVLLDYMLNNGFEGEINLQEFNTYIVTYENNILNDRRFSKSDKEFLLKSSSVARHSANFWNRYENSKAYTANREPGDPPRWIRWLIVGAADVVGGAAGGGAFSVGTAATASLAIDNVIDETKD